MTLSDLNRKMNEMAAKGIVEPFAYVSPSNWSSLLDDIVAIRRKKEPDPMKSIAAEYFDVLTTHGNLRVFPEPSLPSWLVYFSSYPPKKVKQND